MRRLFSPTIALLGLTVTLAGCIARTPAPVVDARPATVKPPAVAAAPAVAPDTYTVKQGDTLYSIAREQGVDVRDLASLNQVTGSTKLSIGQVLRLRAQPAAPPEVAAESGVVVSPIVIGPAIDARPLGADAPLPAAPATATPAPVPAPTATPLPPSGSAPAAVAAAPAAAAGALKTEPKGVRLPYSDQNLAMLQRSEIAALSPKPEPAPPPAKADAPAAAVAAPAVPAAKAPEDPPADRVDWGWPAGGKVVSSFDGAASKGVGISGKIGDPIYASAAGRVVYSGEGIPAYGKLIIIRHNSTYLSAYGHNSQLLVKEGQTVTKGQKIAELGTSGAKQAVLLFEIRRLGKPVDPMQYLPQR